MKKILSLTLVLVLVLSSFSMAFAGTSQKFEDVEDADVLMAVERLSGFGIVDGYEDGTYKPEGMVTRAEFSKMLVSALGLENAVTAAKGSSQFTDVSGTEWYAGAVNVAAGQGVVGGYPDGSFQPNAQVTYGEAVTMLVRALGYKDAFLPGTWPNNYIAKAAQLDITDDVKFFATGYADRGSVAVLVNNTLDANIIEQDKFSQGTGNYNENTWVESDYKTLLTENLDINKFENVELSSTPKVESGLDSDQATFRSTNDSKMNGYFDDNDNEFDLPSNIEVNSDMMDALEARLGESLNIYLDDDELVYFETPKNAYAVKYGTLLAGGIDTGDDELTITFVDGDDKDYDYDDDDIIIYIDNEEKDEDDLEAGLFGKFVIADNGDIALVDLHDWDDEALIVTKSSDDEIEYIKAVDSEKNFESDDFDKVVVMDTAGKVMNMSDLEKDDIIYINEAELAESGDDVAYVFVVETAAVVETAKNYDIDDNDTEDAYEFETDEESRDVNEAFGTISSDNDDEFVSFKDADAELESVTDKGAKVEILFDIISEIRHIRTDVDISSNSQFGIILGTDEDGFDDSEVKVKLLTADEDKEVYELDHKGTGTDNDFLNMDEVDGVNYTSEASLSDLPEGLIVKYTLNSDGEIDSMIAITTNGDAQGETTVSQLDANDDQEKEDVIITLGELDEDIEDDSIEFKNGDDYTIASNVVVFDITDKDPEDMNRVDFDNLVDKGKNQVALVVANEDEEAELIIIDNKVASDDQFIGYILDTRERDDVHYFKIDVYGEGVVEYEVDNIDGAATAGKDYEDIAEESIIVFTENSDGTIDVRGGSDFDELDYLPQDVDNYSDIDNADFEVVIGQVVEVNGDKLEINTGSAIVKAKMYSDTVSYIDDDEEDDIDENDFVMIAQDGTKARVAKLYDFDYDSTTAVKFTTKGKDENLFLENYEDVYGEDSFDLDNFELYTSAGVKIVGDGETSEDTTAPVITLTGDAEVTVAFEGTYTDAGAIATDVEDGDVDVDVDESDVDTSVAGTYTVTYNAEDAAGNVATEVERTVIVLEEGTVIPTFTFTDVAGGMGIGTRLVKVELDTETPEDYIVAVGGTELEFNSAINAFAGEVPETVANEGEVTVELK